VEISFTYQPYEFNSHRILNPNAMAFLKTIQEIGHYFYEIYDGAASLVRGMKVTGSYFVRPSSISRESGYAKDV
jgi:hypothetical protein